MTNTDEIRDAITQATKGYDVGLVIAALGQATRICFHQVDLFAPHLSEQAREDFTRHLNGDDTEAKH